MSRIILSSNTAWSLFNFRSGLIRALLDRGDKIIVIAPLDKFAKRLEEMGCQVVELPMDNKGTHPVRDLTTMLSYWRLYCRLKADVVLHFTIKPVVYGTLAARFLGIPCINMITGLGTVFIRETWLTQMVEALYRVSQPGSRKVFFQNPDDQALFLSRRLVKPEVAECLPGSGLDLSRFAISPMLTDKNLVFLLIARMLWDKGVGEFVEAARQVKSAFPEVRFQLLGPVAAENRTAIQRSQVEAWVGEGVVEYLGETDDVRPFINKAHCVVLPSYREGTPRTLLEAAAMGRPVIATDVPGCREVLDDGVTGFLCRVKDPQDLAEKITQFLGLGSADRDSLGRAGRAKMEREFDERIVVARYLQAIDSILSGFNLAAGVTPAQEREH